MSLFQQFVQIEICLERDPLCFLMVVMHYFYTIPWWNTRYRFVDLLKKPKFHDHGATTTLGGESWQK
jgi:hypothetical protein